MIQFKWPLRKLGILVHINAGGVLFKREDSKYLIAMKNGSEIPCNAFDVRKMLKKGILNDDLDIANHELVRNLMRHGRKAFKMLQ